MEDGRERKRGGAGGWRVLGKQEGKRGSVGIVAAYLGKREGLKGGGMREQIERNGGDAGRCRSVRGDARGF